MQIQMMIQQFKPKSKHVWISKTFETIYIDEILEFK